MEYRQTFGRDVVIDMVCYRRRGHNEGDDPSMTNPLMYQIIDGKRTVRRIYTEALIGRGDISVEEAEDALRDYHTQLERVFNEVRELEKARRRRRRRRWRPSSRSPPTVDTSISRARSLHRIADAHVDLPEGFTPHPRVKPVLERRVEMSREGGIDWAFGELLALGLDRDGGPAGPAVRAGHPPRHLRAAPLGADRPQHRRASTSRCSTCRTSRSGS